MSVFESLCDFETRLHRAEIRSDPRAMDELLHPAFREFGRSGATYTRDEVLSEFTASPQDDVIWAQDFALEPLADNLALLTYRSAHVNASGALERHTLRASLWQLTPQGWRLRFHQGTPTAPFEKRAP